MHCKAVFIWIDSADKGNYKITSSSSISCQVKSAGYLLNDFYRRIFQRPREIAAIFKTVFK